MIETGARNLATSSFVMKFNRFSHQILCTAFIAAADSVFSISPVAASSCFNTNSDNAGADGAVFLDVDMRSFGGAAVLTGATPQVGCGSVFGRLILGDTDGCSC
jgi:hypothetical protein